MGPKWLSVKERKGFAHADAEAASQAVTQHASYSLGSQPTSSYLRASDYGGGPIWCSCLNMVITFIAPSEYALV